MSYSDALILAAIAFIAGGFFWAALQLLECTRDIKQLITYIRDRRRP